MDAKEPREFMPVVVLVCEHFINEARAAVSELELCGVACASFPARCGRPPVTVEELRQAAAQAAPGPDARTVVFGGCCIDGIESFLTDAEGVSICSTPQCFEVVASKSFVEKLMAEGAFLVTPGWLTQWRQWIDQAGFDRPTARQYFAESMKRIVLLDTGIDSTAAQNLEAFAAFVDLPALQIPVGLDMFKVIVHRRVLMERQTAAGRRAQQNRQQHQQEQADFAMTLDLLSQLPGAVTEKQAFASTASVFTMFFAPGAIVYAEKENHMEPRALCLQRDGSAVDASGQAPRIMQLIETSRLTRGRDHLTLRMASRPGCIRGLEVQSVAFPQYLDRYAHIAQAVGDVCGLAIDNARSHENLVENQKRLHLMATIDSLTGVANRAYFMEKAGEEITRARRYNTGFALVIMDVDYFKQINDNLGHPAGDTVLKAIAAICRAELRDSDFFGRVGGEEFAAILCDAGLEQAITAAERMRQSIASHEFKTDGETLRCTASFGLTAWTGPEDDLTQMFKRADTALYQAKNQGRNRVETGV
ncbi:MAG: diguanylate cyclase [Desulfosalsimonas sp.]|uniref:diguanylate cyclase n=1 Tax=Desulfosalsimonas sp. TaxID=3073848 RepID=UPI003970842A